MEEKQYIAIDLKSFYASVECVQRGLDPLSTNLVVADASRTDKTICLAVSPSLKAYGIPGRPRLFEVREKLREINARRLLHTTGGRFTGASHFSYFLDRNPDMAVDCIVAPPRMALYMKTSTEIYHTYLKYIAPEDIHVYSVDEVFIDATNYLKTYRMTARGLADRMIRDVLAQTGITATAGIGTNLYLAKIAMDIVAKHIRADRDGVRIAELNERTYRERLWSHRPITDFWRIGRGYADTLARHGMFTMGDVARCSVQNLELFYRLFGKNAELLIDHAWGREPCTIAAIKAYTPENTSLSVGQVLAEPYDFDKARLIVREMAEQLLLDLARQRLMTDQVVLTVGYDVANLKRQFKGNVTTDHYGRAVPKQAHGSENLGSFTLSGRVFVEGAVRLFERIVNPDLLVRRMYVVANHTTPERVVHDSGRAEQLNLFDLASAPEVDGEAERREREIQLTVLRLRERYGKNAVLKGMNLKKGATAAERNRQIGGHKA